MTYGRCGNTGLSDAAGVASLGRPPQPAISVVLPVYRPDPDHLRLAICSVLQQTDDSWQLVIVDDASGDPRVTGVLRAAARDPRIELVELGENAGSAGPPTWVSRCPARPGWRCSTTMTSSSLGAPACVLDQAERQPGAETLVAPRCS